MDGIDILAEMKGVKVDVKKQVADDVKKVQADGKIGTEWKDLLGSTLLKNCTAIAKNAVYSLSGYLLALRNAFISLDFMPLSLIIE